jgi:hypothetical protein
MLIKWDSIFQARDISATRPNKSALSLDRTQQAVAFFVRVLLADRGARAR